jgi:predicted transcriptional regulator
MTENDIKNLLYGSIRELTKSRTYYYDSSYKPHWTEEGKKVINELMDLYAEKINTAIKQADEQRAKDMVFNTLKEE